jgi:cell wall-associated NlpC family hydrolase
MHEGWPRQLAVALLLGVQIAALVAGGCGGGAKTVKRAEPPDLASLPPQRRAVVRESYAWLGVPYRYGGCDRGGVDCSCLTGLVYQKAGVALPRSSREMFTGGRSVKRVDLLPGDLVFFRQGGREVSHVGVYVGGSFFIHASTSAGVVSTSLDDAYWAPRYAGARRYLP